MPSRIFATFASKSPTVALIWASPTRKRFIRAIVTVQNPVPCRAPARGAPRLRRGASERWGVGGHFGAPHVHRSICRAPARGAPRLRRGASERWGVGGHFGPPCPSKEDDDET